MNTTIIIVNHQHKNSIVELISSIKRFPSFKKKNIIFIQNKKSIFIDNYLRQFDNIYLFNNNRTKGFSENVNYGIRKAINLFNSEYFLLLNPDIVIKNDFLQEFIDQSEGNEKIGMIGPKLLNQDKSISVAFVTW